MLSFQATTGKWYASRANDVKNSKGEIDIEIRVVSLPANPRFVQDMFTMLTVAKLNKDWEHPIFHTILPSRLTEDEHVSTGHATLFFEWLRTNGLEVVGGSIKCWREEE